MKSQVSAGRPLFGFVMLLHGLLLSEGGGGVSVGGSDNPDESLTILPLDSLPLQPLRSTEILTPETAIRNL